MNLPPGEDEDPTVKINQDVVEGLLSPHFAKSSQLEEPPACGSNLTFSEFSVSPLLVSVDYRAKRLDVQALKRGELWELLNLLPLLEGLEVAFRRVRFDQFFHKVLT